MSQTNPGVVSQRRRNVTAHMLCYDRFEKPPSDIALCLRQFKAMSQWNICIQFVEQLFATLLFTTCQLTLGKGLFCFHWNGISNIYTDNKVKIPNKQKKNMLFIFRSLSKMIISQNFFISDLTVWLRFDHNWPCQYFSPCWEGPSKRTRRKGSRRSWFVRDWLTTCVHCSPNQRHVHLISKWPSKPWI